METDNGLHVVFGGGGGAGGALVRELAARGRRVRAVSRSGGGDHPRDVEVVRADASDPASARQAAAGAAVLYHAVNVPYQHWTATLPPVMDALIGAAAAANARLVYVDNLYAYGPVDGPMTEELPDRATTRKGRLRAELAETLLAAHRAGTVRAAIGRAADFYGTGANSIAGDRLFRAVVAGKKASWPATLDAPHSMTYLPDYARVLATLGEREEAFGEVWHAPPAPPLTGREFIELAFAEAGTRPKLGVLTPTMVRLAGLVNPMIREFAEMGYQFARPFVLDGAKFQRAFGGEPTPHAEAIRQTLAWYREHPTS